MSGNFVDKIDEWFFGIKNAEKQPSEDETIVASKKQEDVENKENPSASSAGMAQVELRVAEVILQADIGRGIVRIGTKAMKALGIGLGDIVELEGKSKTASVVDNEYSSDVGFGIIRMDGLTRRNAGSSIGELVTVKKVQPSEAKKVTIAPAMRGVVFQMMASDLNQLIRGRAVMEGDVIQLKSLAAKSRNGSDNFDMFDVLDDGISLGASKMKFMDNENNILHFLANGISLGAGEMKFVVVSTSPAGPVRITDMTEMKLRTESVEDADLVAEIAEDLISEESKVLEMTYLPLEHPELFARLGIKPPNGVLLYGPPDSGKTLLEKISLKFKTNVHFIAINCRDVTKKHIDGAKQKIRDTFKDAEDNSPSIIFIDEIDAIALKGDAPLGSKEGAVAQQLLASMDGLKKRGQVIVIAATNNVYTLNPVLRGTDKFDYELELGVLDRNSRKEILQIHIKNMPLANDVDVNELANMTAGFVGADIEKLCKAAGISALRRNVLKMNVDNDGKISKETLETFDVNWKDFNNAYKHIIKKNLQGL